MNTVENTNFNLELKEMIVEETDTEIDPAQIGDDDPLFGPQSPLDLDSLDALQISMALQYNYNVVITDPKQVKKVLVSVNTLAQYLRDMAQQSA